MLIQGTGISCGVYQLTSVGGSTLTEAEYDKAISAAWGSKVPKCAFIVASLTSKQVKEMDFLISLGYEQFGDWRRNPNSTHDIAVFIKRYGEPTHPDIRGGKYSTEVEAARQAQAAPATR